MDLPKIWKSVISEIELSVSRATFQMYFAKSELLSLEGGIATVGIANPIMRTFIETRYYSLVKNILDSHTKDNVSVIFVVLPKKQTDEKDSGPLFAPDPTPAHADSITQIAKRLHIRMENTFDGFAVSTTNQLAYAAATAVAKTPGSAYNPLFIYGGVGVGKTHLMHAVAHEMLKRKPSAKIVYCMGEEFLNEIVEAIQMKTSSAFKKKYRSAELLLVDDIQFIAGKQTAQEEFFHTFNAVHREGGQVILTSDRAPAEISRLEDRLRSRFEGGLIVDISPPDFELRAAIINIKAATLHLLLTPDVVQIIAANQTDTRAIEGFLKRLTTEAGVGKDGSVITVERVTSLLSARAPLTGTLGNAPTKKRVAPTDILDAVAGYFDVKSTTIKGPKRDRPIVRPRQIIMYLCKTELGLTLDDIGGLLGGRDHTTIMHGVETIAHELSTNERLRESVAGIKQKLWA